MHSDIQRGVQMLHAVVQFGRKNPLNPSNARADALLSDVGEAAAEIRAMAGAQESSRAGYLSRSEERRFVAGKIREILRQLALLGKYLPKEHSEVRHKLLVPRSSGYFPLLTRAELFLKFTAPIKTEFLDRGMPADFDVQLRELIERFEAITGDRDSARSRQVGSTAGMKARMRSAVRSVRELNAILTLLLRNDPARFASWRAASHIERAPRRSKAAAEEQTAAQGVVEAVKADAGGGSGATVGPEQSASGTAIAEGPPVLVTRTSAVSVADEAGRQLPVAGDFTTEGRPRAEAKADEPQLGLW